MGRKPVAVQELLRLAEGGSNWEFQSRKFLNRFPNGGGAPADLAGMDSPEKHRSVVSGRWWKEEASYIFQHGKLVGKAKKPLRFASDGRGKSVPLPPRFCGQ